MWGTDLCSQSWEIIRSEEFVNGIVYSLDGGISVSGVEFKLLAYADCLSSFSTENIVHLG